MANNFRKQFCIIVVSMLILASTYAKPIEAHANVGQKTRLPKTFLTLADKVKEAGATVKNRVKKLYNCLIGDENCSANEVILARLIVIIATAGIYHTVSSWLLRIKSHRARRRMERKRLERLERLARDEHKKKKREEREKADLQKKLDELPKYVPGTDCCICQDTPTVKNPLVKPNCGNPHDRFCFNCLANWSKRSRTCPICRGAL